jgi:phosphoribosylamine--glycine ligase
MKVLIVGGGGREHALAWKLAAEAGVSDVLCAPGNAGIGQVARLHAISAADPEALLDLAGRERVDLTVVGPELPLDRGIVDLFTARGRLIFGPSRAAAQLECSKVFAKNFMARHGVPTARYRVCESADAARALLDRGELGLPIVVKADGLAAGKGVVVAEDVETARAAVRAAMDERQFGDAGTRLVLEECLRGPEVSFFALCDGARAIPLRAAQDHKRVFDHDQGPNTGGMGAFSPSPLVDDALASRVMSEIVHPVLDGLRADGLDYRGFLYAGLILTCDGPKVIEFNVRFGDPEAQVVIPAIDGELAPLLAAAADGRLAESMVRFTAKKHVGVVMASNGYPGASILGLPISGLDEVQALDDVVVFHSGTTSQEGRVVTAGGRVLTVVGTGTTFDAAIERAYAGVSAITFDGAQYRHDIGAKARASAR